MAVDHWSFSNRRYSTNSGKKFFAIKSRIFAAIGRISRGIRDISNNVAHAGLQLWSRESAQREFATRMTIVRWVVTLLPSRSHRLPLNFRHWPRWTRMGELVSQSLCSPSSFRCFFPFPPPSFNDLAPFNPFLRCAFPPRHILFSFLRGAWQATDQTARDLIDADSLMLSTIRSTLVIRLG